tara:strand:- start:237 stop:644 length:408 start_codon:yes stop_codon:yes gene_type:complete
MKKGQKKWINDLSCTLYYKGEKRKCFGHNFNHIRGKIVEAVRRQWKLWANFQSDNFHQVSDNEWHGHFICTTGERINYTIIDRKDRIKEAARLLGQVGGMAGTGKKKVRGDSNYYKLLRAKRTLKEYNKKRKNEK